MIRPVIKQCQKACQNPCNKQFQTAAVAQGQGLIHKTVPEFKGLNNNKRITEFVSFELAHGHLLSHTDSTFSADVYGWKNNTFTTNDYNIHEKSTSFGFVQNGWCRLIDHSTNLSFDLCKGMYFSFPNIARFTLEPIKGSGDSKEEESRGIINVDNNYFGIFTIGGAIEKTGRLSYIDGTNTNLIIPPILHGDPCLNVLYLDPNLEQTPHTHPSFRSGFVISGRGKCNLPSINESHDFKPDTVFWIPEDCLHSFKSENNRLDILTFHPDSEFGPSHEQHPMMNNTVFEN